ncbi:MAG: ATP-binding cassette domain-containing protein [Oscillospiraceae bacterium]|nr:ATP-binding cassette domain-containing protein [Oscillospiraceae bacterium]
MQLRVEKLNKSFGAKHVLRDLSFTAQSGVAMGLLGRNGSGKTTTIRTIMGIFPADSGRSTIDGAATQTLRKRIGYLPEERGLYPKRIIGEQMAYIGTLRGLSSKVAKERAKKLLVRLEAEEYYNQKLDTLSKGNQQKIQLAIALITNPDIIILDEPFSGLDPVNSQILKRVVEELVADGKLVLFSSHEMGYVEEFCDDICIIDKGQSVLAGRIREIKARYPRHQIFVTPEGPDAEELRRQLMQLDTVVRLTTGIEVQGRGCLLTLQNEADKGALFSALIEGRVAMDAIGVVEPSLEDIFVEKVGREKAPEENGGDVA